MQEAKKNEEKFVGSKAWEMFDLADRLIHLQPSGARLSHVIPALCHRNKPSQGPNNLTSLGSLSAGKGRDQHRPQGHC